MSRIFTGPCAPTPRPLLLANSSSGLPRIHELAALGRLDSLGHELLHALARMGQPAVPLFLSDSLLQLSQVGEEVVSFAGENGDQSYYRIMIFSITIDPSGAPMDRESSV